jgi:hypothetical protein
VRDEKPGTGRNSSRLHVLCPDPISFILYEWIESFRILLILSNEPNTDSREVDAGQNAAAFN